MMQDSYIDAKEIEEMISDAAKAFLAGLNPAQKADIANANSCLYYGPIYFDSEGKRCSYFDEGAKPFNFSACISRLCEIRDEINNLKIEVAYDDETGESIYESVENSAQAIGKKVFGKELWSHL